MPQAFPLGVSTSRSVTYSSFGNTTHPAILSISFLQKEGMQQHPAFQL